MLLSANAVFSLGVSCRNEAKKKPPRGAAWFEAVRRTDQNLCQTPTSKRAFLDKSEKPSPLCLATSV
jgi:hypothetical protein